LTIPAPPTQPRRRSRHARRPLSRFFGPSLSSWGTLGIYCTYLYILYTEGTGVTMYYSTYSTIVTVVLLLCITYKNGGRNKGEGKHRGQARTQASDKNLRDREKQKGQSPEEAHKPTSGTGKRARGSPKPIGPTPRKAGVGGTSNQGVLNHRRDRIKITNHNRDWVKALSEPLIMSTAPLRSPGGDHLVETGFVTRGLVSVRMDTRRNVGVEDH